MRVPAMYSSAAQRDARGSARPTPRDGRLLIPLRPSAARGKGRLDARVGLVRSSSVHSTGETAHIPEDAAKVAPHVYKVLFENERARLLEVIMHPGDHSEMHSHPDNLVYVLSDGKVTFTAPSGETAEVELTAGASMWMEATQHATENVGGTAVRALFFEPK